VGHKHRSRNTFWKRRDRTSTRENEHEAAYWWWRWEVADEGVEKRRRASRNTMDRIISRRESMYEPVC
jgi:hypothetical protein